MIDIRPHHLFIAFFIAMLGHALAIYGISLIRNTPEPFILPQVIQGMLIAPPRPLLTEALESVATKPAPAVVDKPLEKLVEINKTAPEIPREQAITLEPRETQNAVASSDSAPAENTPAADTATAIEEPVFTPPQVDARSQDNPPPVYPRIARRLGQEGTVLLEVFILENGSVGEVRLKNSSGHTRLDAAALEAVKHWRYMPARLGNKPVSHWYTQSVKFVLN